MRIATVAMGSIYMLLKLRNNYMFASSLNLNYQISRWPIFEE